MLHAGGLLAWVYFPTHQRLNVELSSLIIFIVENNLTQDDLINNKFIFLK